MRKKNIIKFLKTFLLYRLILYKEKMLTATDRATIKVNGRSMFYLNERLFSCSSFIPGIQLFLLFSAAGLGLLNI